MVVHALFIDDWGVEGGEEWDGPLQLIISLREEGPVRAIAPAGRVLVDLGEHSLANGEVMAYGVLQRKETKKQLTSISHAHIYTHANTSHKPNIHAHTHTHTHAHTHTHTRTHTHTHTHTHTRLPCSRLWRAVEWKVVLDPVVDTA